MVIKSKFLTKILSKLIGNQIKKKTESDVEVHIDQIEMKTDVEHIYLKFSGGVGMEKHALESLLLGKE